MKNRIILIVAAALILGLASFSHAKYVSGFKVMEVVEKQVTIQKGNADPVIVSVEKEKYEVGDKVKFDAKKMKIKKIVDRKGVEGC